MAKHLLTYDLTHGLLGARMQLLTVSQLAKATEVRADTVRYYERIGMIGEVERTGAGYRKFDERAAERVRFIKNAQGMGFSLDEIKQLLELASDEGAADCSAVRDFARQKAADLEKQIRQMRAFKRELETLAAACPDGGRPLESCKVLARMNSKLSSNR
jgi:DNA-binding transcriptional MerR regulator